MSSQFQTQMPSTSTLFSAYASISTLTMLIRSIINDLIPTPIRDYIFSFLNRLFHRKPNRLTLVIEEFANHTGIVPLRNQLYDAAELYLTTKLTTPSTNRLKISKSIKDKAITVRFHMGETIDDSYDTICNLRWCFFSVKPEKSTSSTSSTITSTNRDENRETRYFELTLDKEHKDKVINSYLPYIISKYNSTLEQDKPLRLCTLGRRDYSAVKWDSVNLDHPFTFDTLAMDPVQKNAIKDDLDRFLGRKEFYRRVGRAWKRGYLLYGPPGTGKSSLIAAMANYLRFDIYDLQLGNWMKDSDLRRLLLATANRSILVIEDIDCSVEVKDRCDSGQDKRQDVQLTLSGLLNFIDGLWSSCGDERIIIFTTNHKEKLDPALLRPGRMDMHIHMSYLTVQGFRILVSNYLGITSPHPLSEEIERLIKTKNVTPAQVAEELMRTENVDKAFEGVLKLLKRNKVENVIKQNDDAKNAKIGENCGKDDLCDEQKENQVAAEEEKDEKVDKAFFGKAIEKLLGITDSGDIIKELEKYDHAK